MNQLPLGIVSQVRNRDDAVMAPLFARGVSLLNSSSRAPAGHPPLVLLHPLGSTGEMSFRLLADRGGRQAIASQRRTFLATGPLWERVSPGKTPAPSSILPPHRAHRRSPSSSAIPS